MDTAVKSVLVTGAAGGIGSAAVRRLAGLGWRVFAGVRSAASGATLAADCPGVTLVELDLCDDQAAARARALIAQQVGPQGLDGLINNAGLSADGPLELVPLAALRRQFEVNVIGQVAVVQAFLPLLRAARGRILNVGGAAGRMTLPMYGALSASKAALDSLSSALRMELRHQGVAVSYIEPGAVRTEFFGKSAQAARQQGYAGDARTLEIYARAIAASASSLAASPASPVAEVVEAVVEALSSARPAARYVVGRQARLGLKLMPKLPTGMRDRLLMSSLGLSREVFGSAAP